ncbi:protein SERAC1, partial [Anoplophora glabripennis]
MCHSDIGVMIHKHYPNLFKYLSLTFIGTSAGWVYYQIKRTQDILETAVDTSVLKIKGVTVQQEEKHIEEFFEVEPYYPYEQSSTLRNIWDTLKFAYARRLVRLANSDNKIFRVKAIKQLAQIKNLDKWHCALLANMIDPRTAVALARSGSADKRLFMEPPLRYHNYNRDMIINAMREFLISLFEKSQHLCMGYFLSKAFVYEHDNSHIVDHDSSSLELSKFIQSENDVLPKCLESLLHHSTIQKHAKDIVDLNGLPLLMEIHNRYKDNINITIKLCQIISYMSHDRSFLQPMHKSGWIGILSEWLHHEDIRVSIPAARALANLDVDNDAIFSQHLYLLHPVTRTVKDQELDVIFVHGLLGGVFYTWRQRNSSFNTLSIIGKKNKEESILPDTETCDREPMTKTVKGFFKDLKEKIELNEMCKDFEIVYDDIPVKTNVNADGPYTCMGGESIEESEGYTHCWPKDWLPKDCQNLRIIGINYNTSLSMWAPICPAEKVKFTLEERSEVLLEKLLAVGVGTKPIVWITHSMGGLIVKRMLCN